MRGKNILILLGLFVLLSTVVLISCQGKAPEPPAFKKPDRPPAQPLTPEQQFQKAIAPFVMMLETAQILEEGQTIDNPAYPNIVSIRDMLASGTPLDQVDLAKVAAKKDGPYPGVKPADVHAKFAQLMEGLAVGKPSKIIWAEGLGFGLVYLIGRDDAAGTVEVAIISVQAMAATTTEAGPGAVTTEMPSGTSTAPPGGG